MVNPRILKRRAIKRQHVDRWAIGHDELAPGVVGDIHVHPTLERYIREMIGGEAGGVGQLLVLTAPAASIPSGGGYVTFTSIAYQRGFADVSAAGSSFIWPASAVGGAEVEFSWADHEGGGTLEIEVDGSVPAWGVLGDGASGSAGRGYIPVDIAAGSEVKLKVTQTSGSAKTASVTLRLHIQDPWSEVEAVEAGSDLLETFHINTAVNVDSTVPASSVMSLASGTTYTVVIDGNWSGWINTSVPYGAPDTIMYPSPGQADRPAAFDAEVKYADIDGSRTTPAHNLAALGGSNAVLLDLGSGFSHREPSTGATSTPDPDHSYSYSLVGEGSPLRGCLGAQNAGEPNGLLRVRIYGSA